jgi:hypothetical protein
MTHALREEEAQRIQDAGRQRRRQLALQAAAAFTPALYYIGDHHDELEEAGIEHEPPLTFPELTTAPLAAPIVSLAAGGHVGALTQFPTFEELNYGPVRSNPIFRIRPEDSGYERMRSRALGE